jgi:hypothetical protein
MSYRIVGLSPEPYRHLFNLSDEDLADAGAVRMTVNCNPGFPDRIELRDLEIGETALLINYQHQPADTPYRASHAIFVRENAVTATQIDNAIPELMRIRPLSIRSFNDGGMMLDADLVDGAQAESLIERLFDNPDAAYLHIHYAKRGCFAAIVHRKPD